MRIKIQPTRDIGLCSTCREAHVFEQADNRLTVICNSHQRPINITKPVTYCNEYDDIRVPWRHDMEKIAWTVTTDKSGKSIGFKPPEPKKHDDIDI
jgi:hypothetical protein